MGIKRNPKDANGIRDWKGDFPPPRSGNNNYYYTVFVLTADVVRKKKIHISLNRIDFHSVLYRFVKKTLHKQTTLSLFLPVGSYLVEYESVYKNL